MALPTFLPEMSSPSFSLCHHYIFSCKNAECQLSYVSIKILYFTLVMYGLTIVPENTPFLNLCFQVEAVSQKLAFGQGTSKCVLNVTGLRT